MLISRAELRLALAAGLSNGLAAMSGLAYGYYSPLAVIAIGSGSYGGAIELGRQRLLGSVLGSVLLLLGYWGLQDVPVPIALAITLASSSRAPEVDGPRSRITGDYAHASSTWSATKVGGLIVVLMGAPRTDAQRHSSELSTWIPLRLFWTTFGVLVGLLSLRLFWPGRSFDAVLRQYGELFADLRQTYLGLAERKHLESHKRSGSGHCSSARPSRSRMTGRLRARLAGIKRADCRRSARAVSIAASSIEPRGHQLGNGPRPGFRGTASPVFMAQCRAGCRHGRPPPVGAVTPG